MSDHQPRGQGRWPARPATQVSPQGVPGPRGGGPPRRRRRRRGLVALVVVLAVLAAAAVIGDQVARSYAQNRVAEQIKSSGLNAKPSVSIEGWPFLTQIAGHYLRAVDISADNVTADTGKLPFSFKARATGVHLNSSFDGATVDAINGLATVPFSSVDTLLPVSGLATMSADPAAGPDAVKVDAGIAGAVTGTVRLASPSRIVIQLKSASGVAAALGDLGGKAYTITVPRLPAGLVVRSVGVTSQGVVATATASNTTLTQ